VLLVYEAARSAVALVVAATAASSIAYVEAKTTYVLAIG
jgi:hypothetical protein